MGRAIRNIINPQIPQAAPPPPPPTPVPTPAPGKEEAGSAAQQATQKSLDDAANAEKKARGRASTILTGGTGDTSQVSTSRRILLGA